MPEKFSKEMLGVGVGLLAVEAGPEVVKNVFNELTDATGAKINFMPEDLSHVVESGVDVAQGIALPLATIMIIYAGLKHIFRWSKEKMKFKQRR